MDLSSFAALHPRLDPTRRLLVLELEHGKANEVGRGELAAFDALCEALEADTGEVCCVCTGSQRLSRSGKPIFIAGANVTERVGWSDTQVKQHVIRQRALMLRIRHLPMFTVAVTHGITLGWGAEFLLTADYTLATPKARIGLPETGLGILPGARGTGELARVVGPAQALRLGCTGEQVDAAEALRIGLVQEVVPDYAAAMARVEALAQRLQTRSPTAVAAYKRGVLAGLGQPEDVRLELERVAYEQCVDAGEAAIGRQNFSAIRAGETPPWGPRIKP
ncbi:MAG: enoyl-CoA hydratase/isomerase family protein [Nannocystaceae bacterium]